MRIAIVQQHCDPRRGGAETSTVEMARALAESGAEVSIVHATSEPTPPASQSPAEAVRFVGLNVGGTRAARSRRFVEAARRLVTSGPYDIVHAITPCPGCHVYQPRGGLYPEAIAHSIAATPSATGRWLRRIGRLLNRRQRYLLGVERRLLQTDAGLPLVACVSQYVRRQVEQHYPHVAPRARVIFNGVGVEPLEPSAARRAREQLRATLRVPDGAALLLFVGHNYKLKGLRQLLCALAGQERWYLAVVGRKRGEEYRRLARRLGAQRQVHFVGPTQDVREWYCAADLLVHPTWFDPCSRVVLEALVCGLPAVTTAYNGAAEALADGRYGRVVARPDDELSLRQAIDAALDPGLRGRCRADSSLLRERLSMRRHAAELLALYRELTAPS